jgi:hypothetical protein
MINNEQSPTGDDPAIIQIIYDAWVAGKKIKEISEQTGCNLETVMRILKEKQKSIIQKGS